MRSLGVYSSGMAQQPLHGAGRSWHPTSGGHHAMCIHTRLQPLGSTTSLCRHSTSQAVSPSAILSAPHQHLGHARANVHNALTLPAQPALRQGPCRTTHWHSKARDRQQQQQQPSAACSAVAGASVAMQQPSGDGPFSSHPSSDQHATQSESHNSTQPQSARVSRQEASSYPPLQAPSTSMFRLPPTAPFTWSFMITYLTCMLIVPIVALLVKASQTPLNVFMSRALEPVAVHAYFVSFSCATAAALVNAVFGLLLAWVLVKYDFPFRKYIDAAVDLPFALPTSVAGLTLATVYSDETFLGRFLEAVGLPVVFTRLGVALAMVFVSFPFVVRTMQPVIQEMQPELEEAAWTLGASPWKTFTQVLLPPLLPPLLTGTALAFSRALGEFGSIVIISSNFAFKDLIAPVLIFQCLEQYDFTGATIIGTVLLGISLVIMLLVNWIQTLGARFKNK